jgi:hypothetical protein
MILNFQVYLSQKITKKIYNYMVLNNNKKKKIIILTYNFFQILKKKALKMINKLILNKKMI